MGMTEGDPLPEVDLNHPGSTTAVVGSNHVGTLVMLVLPACEMVR